MDVSYIVVDTTGPYVYSTPSDGKPFTSLTARLFAQARNEERKPGYRTYKVCRVTPLVSPLYDDSMVGLAPNPAYRIRKPF